MSLKGTVSGLSQSVVGKWDRTIKSAPLLVQDGVVRKLSDLQGEVEGEMLSSTAADVAVKIVRLFQKETVQRRL